MYSWEPKRTNKQDCDPRCLKRIQRDICEIVSTPPEGILAEPDESNIRFMDVLMMGPKDTPYEGGMFHFLVELQYNFPQSPPKVKLLTTDNRKIRFNPNVCGCGYVCFSLLNPRDGGTWSPVITLSVLMVAIQSLMNKEPYDASLVPYEKTLISPDKTARENYNEKIQYETIRIAAIDVFENRNSYPKTFISEIEKAFVNNYDFYIKVCNKKINDNTYDYETLLKKLEALKPSQMSVTS